MDDPDKPQQIVVGNDNDCLVSSHEKLPFAVLQAVEALGVNTVDMAHASGKYWYRGFGQADDSGWASGKMRISAGSASL